MLARFRMKGVLLAVLLAVVASVTLAASASAEPQPGVKRKGFRLFARSLGAMTINRVVCGLSSTGQICTDSTNSSTIGGGFWPKGTPDQYIFNTGLQLAGIIGPDGGPWANDTTGAFFFDPKGTTEHGEELQPIYNLSNPDDKAAWPDAACVPNINEVGASIYNPLLQSPVGGCAKSASQGDIWWMSWDGNPTLTAGRSHPLGIAVETRGLGWNFPAGNNDIIYFVYTFYNVTSTNAADYTAYRPSTATILLNAANKFQTQVAARGVTLPPNGYTLTNLFAAFGTDMDVAEAGSNYASVNLPFALGYTYDHSFSQPPAWTFDPRIFSAPFFQGSGFAGVKYLKSPTGPGEIQLYSNTINRGVFDDAQNVKQLFRYLSGTVSTAAGDAPCNTGDPAVTHICYINNSAPNDMRFFQSSTALSLAPGQSGSIVVAYIFAAPVTTAGCGATCDVKPGDPRRLSDPSLLFFGANTVDSLTGYTGFLGDVNGDGVVEQGEFTKPVAGSLLDKALIAQSVFDNQFLLPFAPEPPDFFLVPGDNQVTVLWRPTVSETTGDPFFAVAQKANVQNPANPGNPADTVPNALYDPNYRQFDVEGYRVYRGRVDNPAELQLLAQFDYSGTTIDDFAGQINPTDECAPELGITASCPTTFDPVAIGAVRTASVSYDIVGNLIQVQFGKRAALASGKVIITGADTAVTGGATEGPCLPSACPKLANTGVPFVYTDNTPRNNFRYFYSVTAFDVNSYQSAPSSLESPRVTKAATPVAPASNFASIGQVTSSSVVGRGVPIPAGNLPTIDATTGKFSGPFPAPTGWSIGLGAFVSQVLAQPGALSATLDSITLGAAYAGIPHQYWFTASASGVTVSFSIPITQPEEVGVTSGSVAFQAVPIDNTLAGTYGGDNNYKLPGAVGMKLPGPDYLGLFGRGCVNGRPGFDQGAGCSYNGSRWFDGPSPANNETASDPIGCNTANFSGVAMTCYNNAGALTGVTTIYNTQCYQSGPGSGCRQMNGVLSGAWRAGDFNVYWGAGGVIDSVIDVSTNVPVPGPADGYADHISATWGILNQSATSGTNPDGNAAVLTNKDMACVEPLRTLAQGSFTCPAGTPAYLLSNTAVPGPVGFFSGGYPPSATVPITTATNNGFVMYIVGDMFTFELAGGAVPPSGAVWTLRKYVGAITGGNGSGGSEGPYAYANPEVFLPFTAIGAQIQANYTVSNTVNRPTSADLRKVHTVPDPYYVTNEYEQSTDNKVIKFVNLPRVAIIRIYSSSGVLVQILEHNSALNGGDETWNVRNRNNQVVASGVYFYHIESNDAGGTARRIGRMTIINYAQ
jgi:hypothetical protein